MLNIVLFFLYSILFIWIISKWNYCKDNEIKRFVFPLLFGIKLFFGFLFFLVYTYYYGDRSTADMYKYFDDSQPLFNCLIHHPSIFYKIVIQHDQNSVEVLPYLNQMNHWQLGYHRQFENSHQFIILFNVFCRFFSFGQILPHIVFINFLSFIGLIGIWRSFILFFESKKIFFLIPVFLIPSVLFWCSGLLKETLLLFALGIFLYHFSLFLSKEKSRFIYLMSSLFFYVLLFIIKSYIAIAFLPLLLVGIILFVLNFKHVLIIYLIGTICIVILGFGIQNIVPSINPSKALNEKINGFKEVMNDTKANSKFEIGTEAEMNTKDIIKLIPRSILTTLIRPFPWEAKNPFTLLVVIENLFFAILFIGSIVSLIIQHKEQKINDKQLYLLLSVVSIIIISYFIIGITSSNFGALVRYKAPFLIFLFSIPAMLTSDKIVEKVNNFRFLSHFMNKTP